MIDNRLQSLQLLIIDDQEIAQTLLLHVLKAIGVERVEVASTGIEALNLLKTAGSAIDLIICDIHMPEMSGYKFARQVRLGAAPGYQEVPILMLTGDDSDANMQNARVHRVSSFIVKPATPDDLRMRMLQALGLEDNSRDQ